MVSSLIYFLKAGHKSHKDHSRTIVASIFLLSIFASLIRVPYVAFWHFVPVSGLLLIFVAEVVNKVFSKNALLFTVKVVVVILLVNTFALNLNNFNIFSKTTC